MEGSRTGEKAALPMRNEGDAARLHAPLAAANAAPIAAAPNAAAPNAAALNAAAPNAAAPNAAPPMYDMIELFFFAYRDFVGDADRLLEKYKFGRAHHRVLHFVHRQPGLKIAEILAILQITKQSLGRVLRELLESGYIEVRPGPVDRRQRLLFPTEKGRKLALDLAQLQSKRFARVFEALPPGAYNGAVEFLLAMIEPQARGPLAQRLSLALQSPRRHWA